MALDMCQEKPQKSTAGAVPPAPRAAGSNQVGLRYHDFRHVQVYLVHIFAAVSVKWKPKTGADLGVFQQIPKAHARIEIVRGRCGIYV